MDDKPQEDDKPRCETTYLGYSSRESAEAWLKEIGGGRCWECSHFEPLDYIDEKEVRIGDWKMVIRELDGHCRRHAPRPITNTDLDEEDPKHFWPVVSASDWCGEFVQFDVNLDSLIHKPEGSSAVLPVEEVEGPGD